MPDDDPAPWAALVRAPGLTISTLERAIALLGSARAVLCGSPAAHEAAGLGAATRNFLASPAAGVTSGERRWLENPRHHLLPYNHAHFPRLLKTLEDCPPALYISGSTEALADPSLAIVGSRNPTSQGRETARAFAAHLAARGLAIASGGAEGIDAAAHRGTLDAQGITVAVFGTGIDVAYPACNRNLFAQIELDGALISEFPLSAPPRARHFPRRNRLIAGLSLGTVVVEAARRSGSLITARLANSYGREVFAIPGSIHSPMSRGCHELIKSGAKLVESADDILTELNFSAFFANDLHASVAAQAALAPTAGMDKEHKILLDALGFDPVNLDALVVRTGFKPEAVSSMMLILELEGHVQAAPGGRYSRAAYRRAGGER